MGNSLAGKVALVTGSGQGVGRAIAIALADEGAKVVTNNRGPVKKNTATQLDEAKLARLTSEELEWFSTEVEKYSGDAETTAAAIRASGGEATACYGDISNFQTAKEIVEKTAEIYGSVDIIVNVAGAFGFSPVEKLSEELWDKVTSIKPKGYFNIIRHAVPYMKKNGWGRIINCTSGAFMGGALRHIEYCVANAGAVGLTWGLACELYDDGITVNAFAPAAKTRASVDMELFDRTVEKEDMSTKTGIPIVTYEGTKPPELFAPFIAYLASDEAKEVTGSVFFTAGGMIARYSNPEFVASMTDHEGWTAEKAAKKAPETLFKDYKNINQI